MYKASLVLLLGSFLRKSAAQTTFLRGSDSPVIGILSQPTKDAKDDYIAASYVKWLEAGGARSIPIPYDAFPALVDDIFEQINAVLLPGGACDLPPSVIYLLNKVVESNNQGSGYFPVWGTCLGFEFLLQYAGGKSIMTSGYKAENVSLPLYNVKPKELYANPKVYMTVTQRNVTLNNHMRGITPLAFAQNDLLTNLWTITSTNTDLSGKPFVSTIEPIHPTSFPIYGVQYHPEKNAFEYATYPHTDIPYEAIDHSEAAVEFSIQMARFFVDLARKAQRINKYHAYSKPDVYPTTYSYPIRVGIEFEQIHVIPKAAHWNLTERSISVSKQ